jgi:hypothetical protein
MQHTCTHRFINTVKRLYRCSVFQIKSDLLLPLLLLLPCRTAFIMSRSTAAVALLALLCIYGLTTMPGARAGTGRRARATDTGGAAAVSSAGGLGGSLGASSAADGGRRKLAAAGSDQNFVGMMGSSGVSEFTNNDDNARVLKL